jgi:hypothetical protein
MFHQNMGGLEEIECECMDKIYATQYRFQSWAVVNMVICFLFHERQEAS